jgi:hypothetical protein
VCAYFLHPLQCGPINKTIVVKHLMIVQNGGQESLVTHTQKKIF